MKWVQKDSDITATNGTIIDSLDSDSTKDAPSINAVNEAIIAARKGRLYYISHTSKGVNLGNYDEWIAAGKPEAPTNFN